MTQHISFDLETLGSNPNAPIVQIGAVLFTSKGKILSTFSVNIDIESIQGYDLTIDYSTIDWWFNQDPKAIENVFGKNLVKSTLKKALEDFSAWMMSTPADASVWSHATFDPPVLMSNYRALGLPIPISFRRFKDLRTLSLLAGTHRIARKGTHHVALDDSLYQMNIIVLCFKTLNYK